MGMWFAAGACIALWALVVHGTWGTALAILVGLVFLLGFGFFSAMEFVGDASRDGKRIAELEGQIAELEKHLVVANNTIQQNVRDHGLNARAWQQQLDKYAAELAEKNKRIEALQKGAPKIPKGDDDAIKKLFR